mmetsp:Transcript_16420/g.39690  ORF Transcript_16420/g.39690 Transcript_16420/m.39690 type:complete len:363 (+) Transcript_16420:3-1091(+)
MMVFPVVMGMVLNSLAELGEEAAQRRRKMMQLVRFLRWRRVPRALRDVILRHMTQTWSENGVNRDYEQQLLPGLSPFVRRQLTMHTFGNVLRRCPFMVWMLDVPLAVQDLARRSETQFLDEGDVLYTIGEKVKAVYSLNVGSLLLTDDDGTYFQKVMTMRSSPPASVMRPSLRHFPMVPAPPPPMHRRVSADITTLAPWTPNQNTQREKTTTFRSRKSQMELGQDEFADAWQETRDRHGIEVESLPAPSPSRAHFVTHAPAFLNESVLWNTKLEKFGLAMQTAEYLAAAYKPCELVRVLTLAFQDVLRRHPQLVGRLKAFRATMRRRAREQLGLDEEEDGEVGASEMWLFSGAGSPGVSELE